eukprot:SAG11_NODE_457_length_9306_cov_2.887803_7_plen_390_part_00
MNVWNVGEWTQRSEHGSGSIAPLRTYNLPMPADADESVEQTFSLDASHPMIAVAVSGSVEFIHDPAGWWLHDGAPSPSGMFLTIASEMATAGLKPNESLVQRLGGPIINAEDFMKGRAPELLFTKATKSGEVEKQALYAMVNTCRMIKKYPHVVFEADAHAAYRGMVHKAVAWSTRLSHPGYFVNDDSKVDNFSTTTALPLLQLLIALCPGCTMNAGKSLHGNTPYKIVTSRHFDRISCDQARARAEAVVLSTSVLRRAIDYEESIGSVHSADALKQQIMDPKDLQMLANARRNYMGLVIGRHRPGWGAFVLDLKKDSSQKKSSTLSCSAIAMTCKSGGKDAVKRWEASIEERTLEIEERALGKNTSDTLRMVCLTDSPCNPCDQEYIE